MSNTMSLYQYITIEAKPQALELILDPNSVENRKIREETTLAYKAHALKLTLEDITRVEHTKQGAETMARLAQKALDLLK